MSEDESSGRHLDKKQRLSSEPLSSLSAPAPSEFDFDEAPTMLLDDSVSLAYETESVMSDYNRLDSKSSASSTAFSSSTSETQPKSGLTALLDQCKVSPFEAKILKTNKLVSGQRFLFELKSQKP
jgi:hypothetical protein